MKVTNSVVLMAIAASGAFSADTPRPSTPQFAIVQGASYLGAIVPAEKVSDVVGLLGAKATSYWTPDAKVVGSLEAKLRGALEVGLHSPDTLVPGLKHGREFDDVTQQVAYVLARLSGSRRQYIGIVLPDGSKRILVNGFPGARDAVSDPFRYWRDSIVAVADGGASFWRIQFVVSTGEFTGFDSNGYA